MQQDYYDYMHDRITKAYENKEITYEVYVSCMSHLNNKYKGEMR
ncbi:hypothetical protein BCP78_0056 [Bacillus phage BCP78]|uniref:Uncharacterized protein n=2 Tax=Tsarbombavirus BCP78 TaxID=1985182 RepID=A0A2S0CS86_9CAUD|nr:hypothetical protein BCP78_0056 [Bacillus phage BCP78]AEW47063.1 hypothetical protein BCP78_0056 [Bacillus phage BCP78]AQN32430.1 hypothetical protein BCP12_007 [Bacillus phage BCP12]